MPGVSQGLILRIVPSAVEAEVRLPRIVKCRPYLWAEPPAPTHNGPSTSGTVVDSVQDQVDPLTEPGQAPTRVPMQRRRIRLPAEELEGNPAEPGRVDVNPRQGH